MALQLHKMKVPSEAQRSTVMFDLVSVLKSSYYFLEMYDPGLKVSYVWQCLHYSEY